MNIALIIAGGSGQRMHQDIPKQFINVEDKPVIIYTLEAFQKHPDIDSIFVVCLEGWHEILCAYAKQFEITKLKKVSIRNGVMAINEEYNDDDIILVHDAIRPMLSQGIISDNIAKCKLYGSSIASIPCGEAMLETDDKFESKSQYNRDKLMRAQTPQAFPVKKLVWAHKEALKRGIKNSVASCTLMIELGEKVYFSAGSEKNIKLTTPDDIDIFKALLATKRTSWLKK